MAAARGAVPQQLLGAPLRRRPLRRRWAPARARLPELPRLRRVLVDAGANQQPP
jgi:hypothetical protein